MPQPITSTGGWQMSRGSRLLWKLLLVLFVACTLADIGAWFFLLTTICSNPRSPVPQAQQVIPYSCHGMTVYLSQLQNTMLHWLVPAGIPLLLLSLVAGGMVLLGMAKVRIDVKLRVADRSKAAAGEDEET